MLVHNKENYIVVAPGRETGRYMRLWCGWTEVDDKDWEAAQKLNQIKGRVKLGKLLPLSDKEKGKTLSFINCDTSICNTIIKETFNVEQLKIWKLAESQKNAPRSDVILALDDRIKFILSPSKKD